MTSLEDLLWLYKMAVQFNLEGEKRWLKEEIETRMAEQNSQHKEQDPEESIAS